MGREKRATTIALEEKRTAGRIFLGESKNSVTS